MKLAGRNAAPYREPAGGYAASAVVRVNCDQLTVPSDIYLWDNVTLVDDYHLDEAGAPVTPGGIAPYPRANDECPGSPPIVPVTDCFDPDAYPSATKYCANQDWNLQACAAEDATHDTRYENCYLKTGTLATYSACVDPGFRAAQALHHWHGRFGFLSHDPAGRIDCLPNLRNPEDYNLDYCVPDEETDCDCAYESEQATPDGTKYLGLDAEAWVGTYDWDGNPTDFDEVTSAYLLDPDHLRDAPDLEAHAERHVTVNRYSGVTTQTEVCGDADPNGAEAAIGSLYSVTADVCRTTFLTALDSYRDSLAGDYTVEFTPNADWSEVTAQVKDNGTGLYVARLYLKTGPAAAAVKVETLQRQEIQEDTGGGYVSKSPPQYIYYATEVTEWQFTNTTAHYWHLGSFDWTLHPGILNPTSGYYEYGWRIPDEYNLTELALTLASAYTAATFWGDCVALSDAWDLSDDATNDYTWRTDDYAAVAPLLSYNGYLAPVEPVPQDCGWTDPMASVYDGAILGTPNPPGYENHFNLSHQTWTVDEDCGEEPFVSLIGAYAGASPPESAGDPTDAAMPRTATQWTENWWAKTGEGATGINPLGAGAWVYFSGGSLLLQKYAECRLPRPSHDFFRPCGQDRFKLDETQTACVTAVTGTNTEGDPYVVTLHQAVDVITGTHCYYGGYVWSVTKNSTTEYELDYPALMAVDAQDQPGHWDNDGVWQADAYVFGPLRWPEAWPICGRRQVKSATAAVGTVTVVLASAARFLRTGDKVDFTDALGAVTESELTVTVVDDWTFTFSGSVPTGTFVKSHDAPAYAWHDSQPKFDYQLREWEYDYRDIGEADRMCALVDGCDAACGIEAPEGITCDGAAATLRADQTVRAISEFTCTPGTLEPACRMVICVSPNAEDFAATDRTGVTHAFPESFVPDERYGSKWWALPMQQVADPLWQAPHKPCVDCEATIQPTDCPWLEDSGSCAADDCNGDCAPEFGNRYYPQRPYVEAMCEPPETAPALPEGLAFDCPTLADCNPPTELTGENVALTPTPWGVWLAQRDCVCSETPGRFAEPYSDNGAPCF